MSKELTNNSEESLLETFPLPEDFTYFSSHLLVDPSGKTIIIGGANGKIGIIDRETKGINILNPQDFIQGRLVRHAPYVSDDLESVDETLSNYSSGAAGVYTMASYWDELGSVAAMDGEFDPGGQVKRIVAICDNGYLMEWRINDDRPGFRIIPTSGDMSFPKKLQILDNELIAFSDIGSGRFHLIARENGVLREIFNMGINNQENNARGISTFTAIKDGNGYIIAMADEWGAIHFYRFYLTSNEYIIEEILQNPTFEKVKMLWEKQYPYDDLGVVGTSVNDIAFNGCRRFAVAYRPGIIVFNKETGLWQYDIIRSPLERAESGFGDPVKIIFLSDDKIVAGYDYGPVVIWEKKVENWVSKFLRPINDSMKTPKKVYGIELEKEESMKIHDMVKAAGMLFLVGKNDHKNVVEVYSLPK